MPQNVRAILTIWKDKDIGELAKIADEMLETMDAAIAPWTAIWRSTSRVLPISSPHWKLSSQGKVPCSLAHLLNVCWSCLQCWTVKEKPTTAKILKKRYQKTTFPAWLSYRLWLCGLCYSSSNSILNCKRKTHLYRRRHASWRKLWTPMLSSLAVHRDWHQGNHYWSTVFPIIISLSRLKRKKLIVATIGISTPNITLYPLLITDSKAFYKNLWSLLYQHQRQIIDTMYNTTSKQQEAQSQIARYVSLVTNF